MGKLLVSCGKAVDAGNEVILSKVNPRVVSPNGERTAMELKNGVFTMKVQVNTKSVSEWTGNKKPKAAKKSNSMEVDEVREAPVFSRQGR